MKTAFIISWTILGTLNLAYGKITPKPTCGQVHNEAPEVIEKRKALIAEGLEPWGDLEELILRSTCETIDTYQVCWRTTLLSEKFKPKLGASGPVIFITGKCESNSQGTTYTFIPKSDYDRAIDHL